MKILKTAKYKKMAQYKGQVVAAPLIESVLSGVKACPYCGKELSSLIQVVKQKLGISTQAQPAQAQPAQAQPAQAQPAQAQPAQAQHGSVGNQLINMIIQQKMDLAKNL